MRPSNFPESHTRYKIWVKAFTFKNEGLSSDPIEVLTDVRGPGAPILRNVSCLNDVTFSIEWAMPKDYDRSVDYFVLQYRKVKQDANFGETVIVNDVMQANSRQFEYSLGNLTTEAIY